MAKVLQRLARRGLLDLAPGHARRLHAVEADDVDLGRRHHPGDRRSAHRHRLLDRGRAVRAVREVQRPRSALAHQGPHRRGARHVLAAPRLRPRRRPTRRHARVAHARQRATTGALSRGRQAALSRLSRDDPVDPRVLDEMLPYFTERFGNPHSKQHAWGWEAQRRRRHGARRRSRRSSTRAPPRSSSRRRDRIQQPRAEGRGRRACASRGNHVVTVATEHKSVLDSARGSGATGFEVTRAWRRRRTASSISTRCARAMTAGHDPRQRDGREQRDRHDAAARARSARSSHEHGALLHTDAAQAAGKVPIDVSAMSIDLLSLTAHKFYGPKGAGALFMRRMKPRLRADAADRRRRAGERPALRARSTFPASSASAARRRFAGSRWPTKCARLAALRDRLLDGAARAARRASASTARSSDGCRTTCTSASTASKGKRC